MDGEHRDRRGCGVLGGRGVISLDEVESAAIVAFSGQNPLAYLNERDDFKRNLMLRIAARHLELRQELNDQLAAKVIERLAKAMK